ncbi:MAG: periplasmic heavy metal sensor [Candidatus Melainabacteria bacterium]|nr:periplasmic heavy metal sensor [Candidatus Melainabacteria bacterium]
MSKANKPTLLIVGLLTVVGLSVTQFVPAWAGKTLTQALIDPEMETALANRFKKRFYNLIDANDEQKSKLSSLFSRQLDDARPIRAQIREEVMDLSDLIADESASDEAIRKQVAEIRELREKIQEKRLNTILEARSVLSKDQKKIVSNRLKGIMTGNPRLGWLRATE